MVICFKWLRQPDISFVHKLRFMYVPAVYFVDIDEDNFFLAQHLVIRKLLWGYRFFFQKEALRKDDKINLFVYKF